MALTTGEKLGPDESLGLLVRAVAALNHPNICGLYDAGPDYPVMELVEGTTQAERPSRLRDRLPPGNIIVMRQATEAGLIPGTADYAVLNPGRVGVTVRAVSRDGTRMLVISTVDAEASKTQFLTDRTALLPADGRGK